MYQYLRDKKSFKKYEVIEGEKTFTTPTHSETYSTVTNWILWGGTDGNFSSVLIIQLLLINFMVQFTENYYQRTEYVFMKR